MPWVLSDGCINDNDMIITIMMLNGDDSDDDVVVVLKIYLEGLDMAPSLWQGPALEQETTLTNIPHQASITIPNRLLLQNCKNHNRH